MFRQKSFILMISVFCALIIIGSSLVFNIYLSRTVQVYPSVINNLGVIRGSIQRVVKLESNFVHQDVLIEQIDAIFDQFQNNHIEMYNQHENLQCEFAALDQGWIELKQLILQYRTNPSPRNRQTLLYQSEDVWKSANSTVYLSQQISQDTIARNKVLFVLSGINLLLVVVILVVIKRYVHDNLEYATQHDTLTELFNRAYFFDKLENAIEKGRKNNTPVSLISLDIDYFKKVNDTYGHDVGDSVLKELSYITALQLGRSDTFARVGGEEFAILLEKCSLEGGFDIAEKIRKLAETHPFSKVGKVTISLGITELEEEDTTDMIYKRADDALYSAKRLGRNKVAVKQDKRTNISDS